MSIPVKVPFEFISNDSKNDLYCNFAVSVRSAVRLAMVGGTEERDVLLNEEDIGDEGSMVFTDPVAVMLFHKEGGMNPGTSFKTPVLIFVIIHIPTQNKFKENLP